MTRLLQKMVGLFFRDEWDDFWSAPARSTPLPATSSDRWIDYWGQP